MFYSHTLLSRKGPLGTIWIAAYCFKKLKRNQISATDVSSSIDKIITEIQISHRVLAQLLLGVVKIFSKQVDYLYDECNEVLSQTRKSFPPTRGTGQNKATIRRKGVRDNEEAPSTMDDATEVKEHTTVQVIETMRASYHEATITVPEHFELDLLDLGILDEGDTVSTHQHSMSKEEWKDDRSSGLSFLNERFCDEMRGHSEYNFASFTPLADVLPSGLIDIDLDLSEAYNSSSFVTLEKHPEVSCHVREFDKHVSFSVRPFSDEIPGSQIPINLERQVPSVEDNVIQAEEHVNQTEFINLQDGSTFQNEKAISISEKHYEASPSDRIEHKLNISGTSSPKLTTPAIKERPRMQRKRKKNYDENISLSNEEMRQRIHDASDLACKRRKAPHTVLDGWKSRRLSSLRQNLIEHLIPFSSPELKKLPRKKRRHYLSKICANDHIDQSNVKDEIPHKSSDEEIENDDLMQIDPSNVRDEIPHKSSDKEIENDDLQIDPSNVNAEIPRKPSDKEIENKDLMQIDPSNVNAEIPHKSSDKEIENDDLMQKLDSTSITVICSDHRADPCEIFNKELSSPDASNFQFEIMDVGPHEDGVDVEGHGWSVRTRAAAQYLFNRFLELRERKHEETLSLSQILEGKPRPKCARFFCEILNLKTRGCIDVRQDFPYGDVIISATCFLESCKEVPT